MLAHFAHIQYLPSIDIKSATGVFLGVAMVGVLILGSVALFLGIPGVLMQLCVRYKVINPGAQDLDKKVDSSARKKLKGGARGNYLLHIYASVIIALTLTLGPFYWGIPETVFGWKTINVVWGISVIFLLAVAALVAIYRHGGPLPLLPRVRYRSLLGHRHGLWILGFLTLFQITVVVFLFQIFPFFQQEDDLSSAMYFGLAISFSSAFGIAIRHSWKTAAISLVTLLFLLVFNFNGFVQISETVMKRLKLGNLENSALQVSPAGCRTITSFLGCGVCLAADEKEQSYKIQGLQILSRIGEEYLLAYKHEGKETRILLRSSEVIGIGFPSVVKPDESLGCIRISPVSLGHKQKSN